MKRDIKEKAKEKLAAGKERISNSSVKDKLTSDNMPDVLDALYDKALEGVPKISESVDDLVSNYMDKNPSPEKAAKSLIRYQIAKCGTSGFLTGLGGIVTLPVTVPANLSSVLYVQMRMVAAIAKIGGYDIHSDQVKTISYACLTGSAMSDILKSTGVKIGQNFATASIKRIPGQVLMDINKKVGFRLFTKFGEKGAINMVKLVPVVGGAVGGAFDVATTKIIASNAYRIFIKGEMPEGIDDDLDDIIDISDDEIDVVDNTDWNQ